MTLAFNCFIIIDMIKIHKYEAFGVAVSIGAMALALFFLRANGTLTGNFFSAKTDVKDQSAAVVESQNGVEGVGSALNSAMSGGRVTKLVITDITLGDGQPVEKGDKVTVNYIGTLQNGQEFDNSYKKGEPFTFTVGDSKVIAGWNEGVVGMKQGGQRIIVVPASMGYGDEGYGPIPGGATLVFAIELESVK